MAVEVPQLTFMQFHQPKRQKCDCCDRMGPVAQKVLVAVGPLLVGDFELCASCAGVLGVVWHRERERERELSGAGEELVEREWDFDKGGGPGGGHADQCG
jgi:hypothetical protein